MCANAAYHIQFLFSGMHTSVSHTCISDKGALEVIELEYIRTDTCAEMHTYIHSCMHINMHTYISACIQDRYCIESQLLFILQPISEDVL